MQTADSIEARNSEPKQPESSPQNTPKPSPADRIAPWRWQKGFCPNPSGRPKRDRAAEIAREVFERNPEAVYQAMAKALVKGNAYAFKELAERGFGKLVEKKEVTGKDGGPLEFKEVDESELSERIRALERDLGLAAAIDEAGRVGSAAAGAAKTNGKAKDSELLPR
jgi:hypothetical protein